MRDDLEALERQLQRPLVVWPHLPSGGAEALSSGGVEGARLNLQMPLMTVEQFDDLKVVLLFDHPEARPADDQSVTVDGTAVRWIRPRTEAASVVTGRGDDGEDRPFLDVRPGLVICYVDYLPYLTPTTQPGEVQRALWETVFAAIQMSAGEELAVSFEEARAERIRGRVADIVGRGRSSTIRARRENVAELERSMSGYETSIRTTRQRLRDARDELDMLIRLQETDTGEECMKEFDMLCKHPRLSDVDLVSDNIVARTDHITMSHPQTGETRLLGRCKLTIPVMAGEVTITNLDNPRFGRDHPHVASHVPCFGGYEREFSEILDAGRWYTFVELLFQYLETFNLDDDWGRYGRYWFDHPDVELNENGEIVRPVEEPTVLGRDDDETPIHAGDRVEVYDRNYAQTLQGRVVAYPGHLHGQVPWALVRDDGERGGGPEGSWVLTTSAVDDVYVLEDSAA